MVEARSGLVDGLLGVLIFSASLPATRAAVQGFDPLFLTVARASIAAVLAAGFLLWWRVPLPNGRQAATLVAVALGVVVGFPLLSALALAHVTSSHAMAFIGLLPLSTAVFAVALGGERPRPAFWLFALAGASMVATFAARQGLEASLVGDAAMVAAVVVCGLGYAEGGRLSRTLGGTAVISWALVIALPVMAPLTYFCWPVAIGTTGMPAWIGLGYVSVFSMFVGFLFWYRGLAAGGVARVGQLQLLQPFFGLMMAALLLGEDIGWPVIATASGVLACVVAARRFAH